MAALLLHEHHTRDLPSLYFSQDFLSFFHQALDQDEKYAGNYKYIIPCLELIVVPKLLLNFL